MVSWSSPQLYSHQSPFLPTFTSSSSSLRGRRSQQLLVPRPVCSVCPTIVRRSMTSVRSNSSSGWCHFRTRYEVMRTLSHAVGICSAFIYNIAANQHQCAISNPAGTTAKTHFTHSLFTYPTYNERRTRQTRLIQFDCNGLKTRLTI